MKPTPDFPSLAGATRVWWRIGCLSFGGPAGQIALMHHEVVQSRRWIGEARFLHALNFCTLLPGPEAQQLATYLGWLMHGVRGGLIAGLLFILPGALVMLALSMIYVLAGQVPVIAALFFGLKCAVIVIVVEALLRVARRALKRPIAWAIAIAAFIALFAFSLPFPLVVLGAALLGALLPASFAQASHGSVDDGPPALLDQWLDSHPEQVTHQAQGAHRAGLAALALWSLPVGLLMMIGGRYADIAWFFSKMAVVTFGGAYAVLGYVTQEAVERYAWLSASDMLSGLGLAETTPGPLILVSQFVGFLAGHGAPGGLSGIAGGVVAALLTLWVTFAPCFAFVFLGAPSIERLQRNRSLAGALSAITAAVVGVIANLAVWFALHVLFREQQARAFGPMSFDWPVMASLDWQALLLAGLAALTLFRFGLGVPRTLLVCALAGMSIRMV